MQTGIENNRINKAIETALKNLSTMVDVNTVVGKPIKTENGEYVVPISKVTVGVLSGGGEYGKVGIFKKGSDLPYSAGNGAIISVKPCGFLLKDGEKSVDLYDEINGNSIVKMFDGDAITVYSINSDWAEINYGGKDGYVKIEYISLMDNQDV